MWLGGRAGGVIALRSGVFMIDDRVLPVQLGAVAAAVWCRDPHPRRGRARTPARVSRTGRRSASTTHPVSGRPPPLGRGVPRPTRPASGGRRGRCRGAAGAPGPVGGGGLADPSGDCSEPPAGQEGVSPSIRTTRVRRTAAEVVGAVGHGSALRGDHPGAPILVVDTSWSADTQIDPERDAQELEERVESQTEVDSCRAHSGSPFRRNCVSFPSPAYWDYPSGNPECFTFSGIPRGIILNSRPND